MGQGKRMICLAELRTSLPKSFAFAGSSFEDANFATSGYELSGPVLACMCGSVRSARLLLMRMSSVAAVVCRYIVHASLYPSHR